MTKRPLRIEETIFKNLNENSRNFVLEAVDPFHDYPYSTGKVPDGNIASSFVKKYKRALTLSCPFTLTAGDTWTVNFFTTPFLSGNGERRLYDLSNENVEISNLGGVQLAPLMYYATLISNGLIKSVVVGSLTLDDSDLSSNLVYTRAVGCGFEVHDVTPEVYRQGSCTVWRNTPPNYREPLLVDDGTNLTSWTGTVNAGEIPMTTKDVVSNQNAITWNASEGAYVVSPISDYSLSTVSRSTPALYVGDWNQSALPSNHCDILTAYMNNTVKGSFVCGTNRSSHVTPSGALFAGLSDKTVLRVDLRLAIEFVPGIGSEFNSLASATPPMDLPCIDLVKQSYVQSPAGVKVSENSAGDWFRRIASIVARVAPTILGLFPATKAMAPIVQQASELVLQKLKRQEKPKTPLPPVPNKVTRNAK